MLCGVWCVLCAVWWVVGGVWCVLCAVMVCAVCCVVCGVCCVLCAASRYLDMSDNALSGTISPQLSVLTGLAYVLWVHAASVCR
jgi:hypothetical protein